MYSSTVEQRFWAKVDRRGPDECWPWLASVCRGGYGQLQVGTLNRPKLGRAHQLAWEFANRRSRRGAHVLHRCDNPLCCNPAHLFAGTRSDNMRDMHRKGRGRSKLSPEDVELIKLARETLPVTLVDLAKAWGICRSQVSRVLSGKCWPCP